MKVTIESTKKTVTLMIHGKEVPARVWQGLTESGKPVFCFITRIALAIENATEKQSDEFERDLFACVAPNAVVEAIPMRMIL
jgi:hypothetical protein